MIVWSEEALIDLQEIYNYVSKHSPKNAEMMVKTFVELVDSIEFMPLKFPKEPFINQENIRFITKWTFKIIYVIQKDKIIILNIFNTNQNPEKLILD